MRKSFVFLFLACAGASAFADEPQWQAPWFTGIGSGATISDMKATNGSWTFPAEGATVTGGVLDLDLDADAQALFAVSANTAADTNTLQRINIKGVFTPVKPTDLVSGATMNAGKAQVGFAVVKSGDATPTYQYYAWVGATDGAAAINDWVALTGVTPTADGETDLLIDLARWNTAAVTATFSVKSAGDYVALANGSSATALSVSSTAGVAADKTVGSVACTGSGSISAVDGDVQLGVASIGARKYPTADAAMTAADSGDTVSLNRDLVGNVAQMPGTVTAKAGVKIADNGYRATIDTTNLPSETKVEVEPKASDITTQAAGGASGTYVINTSVATDKIQITLPASIAEYKQVKSDSFQSIAGGGVSYELETADKHIPGSASYRSNMRSFLTAYRNSAYVAANATSTTLGTALGETATDSPANLTYQQIYELGIAPTDSIAPRNTVAKDTDANNITLAIPTIGQQSWAGAYGYKYKIMNGSEVVVENLDDPKIPLEAGSGTFKVLVVPTAK